MTYNRFKEILSYIYLCIVSNIFALEILLGCCTKIYQDKCYFTFYFNFSTLLFQALSFKHRTTQNHRFKSSNNKLIKLQHMAIHATSTWLKQKVIWGLNFHSDMVTRLNLGIESDIVFSSILSQQFDCIKTLLRIQF